MRTSGKLTSGLVQMIQMAFNLPVVQGLKHFGGGKPGLCSDMTVPPQNFCTSSRCAGLAKVAVRRQHIGHAAHFAATHGIGLAG